MHTIADFLGGLTAGEWYGLLAPLQLLAVAAAVVWWARRQARRSDVQGRAAYHAARLRELTVMARHVLGEAEAERWMSTPQPMLGGHTSAAMSWDSGSAAKVEQLLYAIATGMPGIAAVPSAARSDEFGNA